MTQLLSQDSVVLQKESALSSLNSTFGDLATSLQTLDTLAEPGAGRVTTSDSSIVTAINAGRWLMCNLCDADH